MPDDSPSLDAADKTWIFKVLGTLLFYARAIDSTMLTAIGELAIEQSQATKSTMDKLSQLLLNYCAAHHPDATIRFTASDMILAVESDASYLSVMKGRSRAAGYFFLTNKRSSPTSSYKPNNGAVHIICHIMREVLSGAAEAELGAFFHNGKEACPLRIALLEELGHPQPATPMATDNNTASGIATDTVKQKRSKVIDMHFIESAILFAMVDFKSIGARARRIVPTTSPSIIQPRIIRPFVPRICTPLLRILRGTILRVSPTQPLCRLRQCPVPYLSLYPRSLPLQVLFIRVGRPSFRAVGLLAWRADKCYSGVGILP